MSEINNVLEELLANIPSQDFVEVEVPSRCLAYKSTDSISIKPMTYEDEKALINAAKIGGNPVHTLLGNCIKGVEIDQLLEIDRIYLIIKLRDISFGNEYAVKVPCESCTFDNDLVFKMDDLTVNFVPDGWETTQTIELPMAKKKVTVRVPKVEDDQYTTDAGLLQENLWRFVTDVEGHKTKSLISKFCEKLPVADRHTIMNAMSPAYGVDSMIKFKCTQCTHMNVTTLPIGPDFLSVKS